MCLLPDLHARQAVAISYTLSQHLLQHRLHSGVLVTLLLRSHFSRRHTFQEVTFLFCVALVWLVDTAAGMYVDAKPKLHFGTTLCAHRVLRN